jgi:hypothetical protein
MALTSAEVCVMSAPLIDNKNLSYATSQISSSVGTFCLSA